MMKITQIYFVAFVFLFSFNCFAQQDSKISQTIVNSNTYASADSKSDDLVVEAYIVEETVNMKFGKSVTKYKVSNLDLLKTHDLGPNNTRTITPLYKKAKAKRVVASTTIKDTLSGTIKPLKGKVPAVAGSK